MTYRKPEINVLGDAARVIQDGTKPFAGDNEFIVPGWMMLPAYDLDE